MAARAKSFEWGAEDYERLRPEFPAQLFDDVCASAGQRMDGRVLEIGAGTGRATLPLVRRGARIHVVEPSADMLRVLGGRLDAAGLSDRCDLMQATFEDVDPASSYDVIVAAQSFHWANPTTRWARMSSLLRDDGVAYLFWNGWRLEGDAHDLAAVRTLYAGYGCGLRPDVEDHRADTSWAEAEIGSEASLDVVSAHTYDWPWRLPVGDYLSPC